jgi:hypothetical protein
MDISARAFSLTDRPQRGHLGHQCSHALGRPNLHLVSSSRRPRLEIVDRVTRIPAITLPTAGLFAMLPDGAVKYLESVGQTERKRTQAALRESEYELRQIIETVPSHRWSTSPDFERTRMNQHLLDYFGRRFEDFSQGGWGGFPAPGRPSRNCKSSFSHSSDRNLFPGCAPSSSSGRRVSLAPCSWRASARPRSSSGMAFLLISMKPRRPKIGYAAVNPILRILNAIEAMRDIGEEVRELLIRSRNEPDGVSVEVRDSIPGFAPAALERVLDAFYTTKPGGLGLGLSICRSIIEAHNGRLWAIPNVPRGAIICFTAPAHPAAAS